MAEALVESSMAPIEKILKWLGPLMAIAKTTLELLSQWWSHW